MIVQRSGIFSAIAWLIVATQSFAQEDLAKRINEVIDGADYKQAHWGILVVDAKTGRTIYEKNPNQLCIPASTTKLYSCGTALACLGADFCFDTPVHLRGVLLDGVLKGDLILVASGDLTMGGRNTKDGKMAFADNDHTYANSGLGSCQLANANPLFGLEELAKGVFRAGIREVQGEVLVDDRLFERAHGSGSGPNLISSMIVNDNVLDIVVVPGKKPGDPAKVRFLPETEFYQMDAVVDTTEKETPNRVELHMITANQFTVRGTIAVDSKPLLRILPVEEPVYFARTLFIEQLRKQGIRVRSPLMRPSRFDLPERESYLKQPPVVIFRSLPLAEAIGVTMKVSHNLYASTLPLLVATRTGNRTLEDGLRQQAKFLKGIGVPIETISFAGGAGGANADAVTPRATIQLLHGMSRRVDWPIFVNGLPILGVDGTLASVGVDSPAKGKVRAKTGTLVWQDLLNERTLLKSKALAGLVETAKGTQLYVALYVNNVPLPPGVPSSREGRTLGRICEIIHLHGP